jgi:Flp pilus assembly protein TadG
MLKPLSHRRATRCIAAARNGVAALEFAILAPIMATILVGIFDITKCVILWEQLTNTALSIAESASALAIQPDGSSSLTQTQAQQALSVIFAEMPWLRAGIATGNPGAGVVPANTVAAVLTSVSYQPTVSTCTASCSYVPVVQWSKAYSGHNFMTGSSVLRPCTTLTQTNPGAGYTVTTVPTQQISTSYQNDGNTNPDPFLVADVKFIYVPFFFRFLTGPVTLASSSFAGTPRSNAANTSISWTTYTTTSDPAAVICSSPTT